MSARSEEALGFVTKVLLPRRRDDVLRRPRLIEFLHEHIDRRLILISASAGYGKTTLLVDFAHDSNLKVCWYSLDEYDADPSTFLRYLIASIRQRFPGFGEQTERLIQNVTDVGKELKAISGALVSEMHASIPEYFAIVLDDFHLVDGSKPVNELMDLLLNYLPEHCHFIMSTRTIPKITLSRLVARRQTAGLGVADLRFTADEIQELMSRNYNVVLPHNRAEELAQETEGWITGIMLTTHTMWEGLFQSMIRARESGDQVFDFLATEVLDRQPPEVQRFLLESSALRQMTPALCDQLLGIGDSGETLAYLEEINLFVSRVEGESAWFRYHHLFHEFLGLKLERENPTRYAELHRRAGGMFEGRRDWNEAFHHFSRAGEHDEAARIVLAASEEMLNSGQWQTVLRWISGLPSQTVASHPEILLHEATARLQMGEVDQAIEVLNQAGDTFRLMDDVQNLAKSLNLRSIARRFKGRYQEAINDVQSAIDLLGDRSTPTAAQARRNLGTVYWMSGDIAKGVVELKQALRIAEENDDFYNVAGLHHELATAHMNSGDPQLATHHYEQAAGYWKRVGNVGYLGHTLNGMGVVRYYLGQYEKALETFEEALGKAREVGYLRVESYVLASMGDVYRDQQKYPDALDAYESSLQIARRVDESFLVAYCLDAIGMTHLHLGNLGQAEKLTRAAVDHVEERRSKYELGLFKTSVGAVLGEKRELKRATAVLKQACRYLQHSSANRELARAEFQLARTLYLRQQLDESLRHFKLVLELVSQLGYDHFLVVDGRRALDFLRFVQARGIGRDEVTSVLRRIEAATATAPPPALASSLSEVAQPVAHSLELCALGRTSVNLDGRLITSSEFAVEKTKELLFYFVSNPGGKRKEQVVEDLWPEMTPGKGDSNFHSTAYRLRRAIFPDCLIFENGRYRFESSSLRTYDVEEFENLIRAAEREQVPEAKMEHYRQAVNVYKGPYLEEVYSDWAEDKREQLEEAYLDALTQLASLHYERREYDLSLVLTQKVLARDAFREEAHLGVMRCYESMGSRSLAIKHYRDYADLLREELDAEPSSEAKELHRTLSTGLTPGKPR